MPALPTLKVLRKNVQNRDSTCPKWQNASLMSIIIYISFKNRSKHTLVIQKAQYFVNVKLNENVFETIKGKTLC